MGASFEAGWTRSNLEHYQTVGRKNLVGADVKAEDGKGNLIEVSVREHGFRICLNGKDIATNLGEID